MSGISIEQTLGDARAINPDIDCVQHDVHADMKLLKQIARWCERYTPLVALSGKDGLFLNITGCVHLFGGEKAMLEDIMVRLKAQGFAVRLGIANTAGAAWALSRYGDCMIAPQNARALLEPLPLDALRLSKTTVRELAQLGFKTIGCLADLPRAPIAARFGNEVLLRLDQALGREDEALSPFQPAAELVHEKRFSDPVVHEDGIRATILILAKQLALRLEERGLGMRKCKLLLFRADGEVTFLEVEASIPMRDAKRIAALFDERLANLRDEWDAGFGFDVVQLSILRSERLEARQEDMITGCLSQEKLSRLVDHLSARLGSDRVQVYQTTATHIPERRSSLAPAMHNQPQQAATEKTDTAIRPILLFPRPELTEVMAEVPEGPPIRFRWRKAQYEVTCFEGPERIACEWWKDGRNAHTRDYFRIETSEGCRLWLFRYGLYERETDAPKWYVQGIFA